MQGLFLHDSLTYEGHPVTLIASQVHGVDRLFFSGIVDRLNRLIISRDDRVHSLKSLVAHLKNMHVVVRVILTKRVFLMTHLIVTKVKESYP